VPPGWYPDPQAPGGQRYWDGQGWTDAVAGETAGGGIRLNWASLVSLRVIFTALICGLLVGALLSAIAKPLGVVGFFVVAGGIYILAALNPENVLYCPYCRKRVKIGATTCHHCGQRVV
jgi:hypothetical protein